MKLPDEVFDLYDSYCHGGLSRRAFFERLGQYAVGGDTVAALSDAVMPNYALAEQVSPDDALIVGEDMIYASPKGAGEMGGYLVKPASSPTSPDGPVGAVVVIHENRGLNPYIRDVARRCAVAGYMALAPDALHPLGGYPGNDDAGRELQRQRDRGEMLEDFIAAAELLRTHPDCSGLVGCIGFCFGGAVANLMAVRLPWLGAAVPFYGGWPDAQDAARVRAPLLIHLGERDSRVNAGWPAYKQALDDAGASYATWVYENANHGFHNDSTPRYDEANATLAWERTLAFLAKHLNAQASP